MAATGGTTSYSPISLLTGTALLPKTTTVAKPVTTVARPASTSAPVSLSNPVLKPVSTMSGSSGSAASSVSRPTGIAAAPSYSGLDQVLAQRYVAPAQQVAALNAARTPAAQALMSYAGELGGKPDMARNLGGLASAIGQAANYIPQSIAQYGADFNKFRSAYPGVPALAQFQLFQGKQTVDDLASKAGSAGNLYGTVTGQRPFDLGQTAGDIWNLTGDPLLNYASNRYLGPMAQAFLPEEKAALGIMGFRNTPNMNTQAFDWAENEALKYIPERYLLNPQKAYGSDKASLYSELDRIYGSSGVIPSLYEPKPGGSAMFGSFAPIPLTSGFDIDLRYLPENYIGDTWKSAMTTPLGSISNAAKELERYYPGVSQVKAAQVPLSILVKRPKYYGAYVDKLNTVYFNPWATPDPDYFVSPQMIAGHEIGHLQQRAAGGAPRGTNPDIEGSTYNYFNAPGERQARMAGAYAHIPASNLSKFMPSDALNIANWDPDLFPASTADRLKLGTPLLIQPPVTLNQYLRSVNAMQSLMNP